MERFFGLEEKTISVCRELIPVGKTRQNIDKYSAMADDELIYENNHLIKDLIKKMALEKIEGALDGIKELFKSLFTDIFLFLSKDELYPCTQLSNHSNRFITLSTCDYDGNYRILVVGERVEGEKIP